MPDDQPLATPEQVALALAGDRRVARRLTEELLPTVQVRVARALLRQRGAARGRIVRQEIEDMVQDVFTELFRDGGKVLRAWDPARGLTLRGFVGLVAEQTVSHVLRSGRRSPWTEDPAEAEALDRAADADRGGARPSPERVVASRELLERLVEGLEARLTPRAFRLFELLFVEERDVEDVCSVTGMKPGAVYTWRSRLRQLAQEIAAELQAGSGQEASP